MNPSKVYLTSKGCFIVQQETNHIAAYLKENAYDLVETPAEAEAIIITTCAVTEAAGEGSYQGILECIRQRKDNVPVYVVGCYSRIEKERTKQLLGHENVRVIPEVSDLEKEFLGAKPWNSIAYNDFFAHPFSEKYLEKVNRDFTFKLKAYKSLFGLVDSIFKTDTLFYYLFAEGHLYNPEVQRAIWPVLCSKGCTHACSYCAVRIGRGKYTSKPLNSILKEVKWGLDKGYKRMLLIGDELGPYGVDLKDGTNLSKLLDSFRSEEFPVQVGLWYLDAFLLMEAMSSLDRLAQDGKIFFLGITLQHGSERVLQLMNRKYSLADTMDAIARLRRFPGIIIATQIMVGFPTETENDFQKSMAMVGTGFFDKVEVFEYSPRPGTRAANMADDVLPEVKRDRAVRLRRLAAKKSKRLLLKQIMNEFL